MPETTTSKTKASPVDATFADGDLGRLQGILFGEQTKHFDERLTALEEAITAMVTRTNSELGNRIASVEADLKHQLAAISTRVDKNSEGSDQGFAKVRDDLGKQNKRLVKEHQKTSADLEALTMRSANELAELRSQSDKNLAETTASLQHQIAELSEAMKADKVGSDHLADLLASTAEAIRNESAPRKGEGSKPASG